MNERLKLPLDEGIKFNMADLSMLLDVLLGENGCPWDQAQTYESLKKYLLEEAYELAEAIDKGHMEGICEEMGDVLFELMFIAKLAERDRGFCMADVVDGICRKMISRHTHIFGQESVMDAKDVEQVWERNKTKEKHYDSLYDKLCAVPANLPALMRAEKVLSKTAGLEDGPGRSVASMADDAIEALNRLKNSNNNENEELIGAILFQIADISCEIQINPEFALTNRLKTYINKFENIENH